MSKEKKVESYLSSDGESEMIIDFFPNFNERGEETGTEQLLLIVCKAGEMDSDNVTIFQIDPETLIDISSKLKSLCRHKSMSKISSLNKIKKELNIKHALHGVC